MKDLPPYAVWNIRFSFALGCLATAAVTIVICVKTIEFWRLVMACFGSIIIGVYCGLWLSVEAQPERDMEEVEK